MVKDLGVACAVRAPSVLDARTIAASLPSRPGLDGRAIRPPPIKMRPVNPSRSCPESVRGLSGV